MPDSAGRKSFLLQEFLFDGKPSRVDPASGTLVESGFAGKERLTMRLGRSIPECVLSVLLLFTVACNSKPGKNEGKSVSSSAEQNKPTGTAPPSGQPSGPPDDANAISYAKNPDRFVQQKTTAPPFTITNPQTATEFFDVGVHEDNLRHYDKAITAYEQALKLN